MKHVSTALFLILIVTAPTVNAQGILATGSFELGGTVGYSYSNYSGPPEYMQTFDLYNMRHEVQFRPSIGYFLSEEWELLGEPLFSFSSSNYNNTVYISDALGTRLQEGVNSYQKYEVGILVGVSFHLGISEHVISFVGTSVGLSWQKDKYQFRTEDVPDLEESSPWSEPTIVYPNLALGLKLFVTENWAFVTQADMTYKSLAGPSINPFLFDKQFQVSFGIGLAVYIGHKNGS